MDNENKAVELLEVTEKNSKVIQELVNKLVDLAAPINKAQAEFTANALEKRIFFQDYLYDCHGALAGYTGNPDEIITDYDEYVRVVTVALMLHV